MNTRAILRNAYDGNYENAIKLLVNILEEQNEVIQGQVKIIQKLTDQVSTLQQSVGRLNDQFTNRPTWME